MSAGRVALFRRVSLGYQRPGGGGGGQVLSNFNNNAYTTSKELFLNFLFRSWRLFRGVGRLCSRKVLHVLGGRGEGGGYSFGTLFKSRSCCFDSEINEEPQRIRRLPWKVCRRSTLVLTCSEQV